MRVSETDIEESLKAVFERTTEGSTLMSKNFKTEMERWLARISTVFQYDAAKCFGYLKTYLPEFTSVAPCEISNCVAMMHNRFASVHETSSVGLSASVSGKSAAAAGTMPSTSVCQKSKEVLQQLVMFQKWQPFKVIAFEL